MRARMIHLSAGCSSLRARPPREWISKSSRMGRKIRLVIRKHRQLRLWRRDWVRRKVWEIIFLINIIGLNGPHLWQNPYKSIPLLDRYSRNILFIILLITAHFFSTIRRRHVQGWIALIVTQK
jgi:polyferredoxin